MAGIELPSDIGGRAIQMTPRGTALARTVDSSISSSTEVTLNTNTRFVRVYAKDKDVYLKWGTDDVSSSNFDEVIPANQIVDFAVPTDTTGNVLFTALNVIEAAASGAVVIIEK